MELETKTKASLIELTGDVEYIKASVFDEELRLAYDDKIRLIGSTKDVEFIRKCIQNEELRLKKRDIDILIIATENSEFIKECINNKEFEFENYDKASLIAATKDIEFIKECVKDKNSGLESKYKTALIESTKDAAFIKDCILDEGMHLDIKDKKNLIKLLDLEDVIQTMNSISNTIQRKEIAEELRTSEHFDIQIIDENIELFLQWENVENLEQKLEVLLELKARNQEILQHIDFKILDEEYLEILGKEKINFISNFPNIQDQILKLNQNELKFYAKILDVYDKVKNKDEWKYLTVNILNNISDYYNIIEEIEFFTQKDIEKAIIIMQNKNNFNLEKLEDLRNYNQIKQSKCDEWINQSENITEKREALLYKIFGQDINYTEKILRQYGQDAESIENQDLKSYILALKEIMEISDNKLIEKIYQQVPEVLFQDVNKILMETSIANEYEKLYNKTLLKVENLEKIEENIYDAGTDFNILMTSIATYYDAADINNYIEDWNRPSLSSPHICCSYIRNDMIGTAPVNDICYGFYEMEPYSLVESNCRDICSNGRGLISNSFGSIYYSPDNQINKTTKYNEMDYSRFQNGKKKQPDYIIVFKENGEIPYIEKAKRASKEWSAMPIVVVDKDRCLENERDKLDNLLEQYRAGNKILAREIYYKIRNNRQTSKNFAKEISIDEFKIEIEKQEKTELSEEQKKLRKMQTNNKENLTKENENVEVTKEDMQKNSEQVSAEERKQEMSKMKQLYLQIHSIAKDDKDVELE